MKNISHGGNASMPVYHFTSPTGLDCNPFDPNGAIFYKGRYHLGYIYQDGGKHFWGHASTRDLINWQMHPPMLSPGPEDGIFSGNAFVDKKGRVVLSYHGLGDNARNVPGGNCLAIAQDDDLNVFKKLEANPVMRNPGWDPHTWFEGGTYYSISGGHPSNGKDAASLYSSKDDTLAKWDLVGPLMSREMPDVFPNEDISCPDLFMLGGKHILLCISHIRGARYYVGRFDKWQFHPEAHYRMNWSGGTCFAPETLLDDRGRRIMWAWVLGSPSTMTLPRVLSMGSDGVMNIEPAEEINTLRKNPQHLKNIDVPADTDVLAEGIKGDCKELQVTIDPMQAAECGVKVRRSPDAAEETAVTLVRTGKTLRIEMGKSTLNESAKPRTYAMTFMLPKGEENPEVGAQEAPFELKPGELLELRIYLDHSIMEVFANGRQCITQRIWPTLDDSLGISFFSRGGSMIVKSFDAWDMSATKLRKSDDLDGIAGGWSRKESEKFLKDIKIFEEIDGEVWK
ncbi:MAG: glycoside hydrolase family 32 protein [Victivallales bacterium]